MAGDELLRELYDQGLNDAQIAKRVEGTDKDRVRRWRKRNDLPPNHLREPDAEYIASINEADPKWPDMLPRPIQVNIPEPSFPKPDRESYVCVHYGDVHFPFQDDAALNVLYQVTADLCPDEVNCHGDLADCYSISKYEKDPQHRIELQDELRQVAEHLGIMAAISPFAKRRWLLGNHEDRLRRLIWDLAQSLPAQQLVRLPNVWEQLEWGRLVGADSAGWEIHTGKVVQFDKLVLKHGDVVRQQSAYSARAELERYQKSGISGHTHRRGVYEKRDLNGAHAWWEHGCLCDLNPSYVSDPNWQQGFLVVTWSADRSSYGVEEVRIHDGTAIFRGKTYGK
jgi:hypothetical protein